MGMVAALGVRYGSWPSVLVTGDFNVDPASHGQAIYDRTDDILAGRGFVRACPTREGGCQIPTYLAPPRFKSAIDMAFFRGGGVWRTERMDVLKQAPRPPEGSDHFPILVELTRDAR